MKKFLALLLAAMMVLSAVPAMADDATPTNNRTLDGSISVSGLEDGDKVDFYQVLEYDENSTTTGGWKAATGFALTVAEIQKILGLDSAGKPVDKNAEGYSADNYGISAELAAKIADWAEVSTTNPKYPDVAASSGTATKDNPAAGLYLGIVKPGQTDYIYNPVFMGADYVNNQTNTVQAVITNSYSPASMAKKAGIPLEKTAEDKTRSIDENYNETISAGDVIKFTVTTTIPEFADNYTNPVFKVSDVLSAGLTLDKNTIKVYKDSEAEANLLNTTTHYDDPATGATDITFTVNFKKDYIKGLTANQPIVITYEAKLTTNAPFSVNPEDNTVTVNYSNQPTDEEGHGLKKDRTNHYTFDIDGNLLGEAEDSWKTTEVIKVGVDANGNEITETVELHGSDQIAGALQGAEFALYTDADCTKPYINDILTSSKKIVSDATGRLTIEGETKPGIRGLDAGMYYLKETKAPAGYIAWQDAVTIEIIPTIKNHTYTETVKIDGVDTEITYYANELESYIVKMNGNVTADYTITNQSDGTWKSDKHDTYTGKNGLIGEEGKDPDKTPVGKIQNRQGVQLPSTGGTGTYMIYAIGAILVLLAGILLVSKRRAA